MPTQEIPNNLGSLLLIALALPLLPLGIGVPVLLVALAQLRTWQGQPAHPKLHAALLPWLSFRWRL